MAGVRLCVTNPRLIADTDGGADTATVTERIESYGFAVFHPFELVRFRHRKTQPCGWVFLFLVWLALEDDASSELDLTGLAVSFHCGDVAEVAGGRTGNVRRSKNRMVESVEGFKTQLHIGGLCEMKIFQNGCVKIVETILPNRGEGLG
jgi:hypothetical protein